MTRFALSPAVARLPLLLSMLCLIAPAVADERPFTFVYDASTMPKGAAEYEQWVTWKTHKGEDSSFDQIDLRHEIEFGVTDNLQLAFYLSDWRYQDGSSVDDDGVTWRDAAVEAIYQVADPTADFLGVAVYGEFKGGDELLELEAKLILQKNLGQWIVAWNGILEAEWEGQSYEEDNGILGQSLGASYQINPRWRLGGELTHEVKYEDWAKWADHVVYVGPNVSFSSERWWVTVTPLFQVTDLDTEPDFQTRLLVGVDF